MSGVVRILLSVALVCCVGTVSLAALDHEFEAGDPASLGALEPVSVPIWDVGLRLGWGEPGDDFLRTTEGSWQWGADLRIRVGGRTHLGLGYQRQTVEIFNLARSNDLSPYTSPDNDLEAYLLMVGWSFAGSLVEGSRHVVEVGPALARFHFANGGTQDGSCAAFQYSWVGPLSDHLACEAGVSALVIVSEDDLGRRGGWLGSAHLGIRVN